MKTNRKHRNKIMRIGTATLVTLSLLITRVAYIAIFESERLMAAAESLHERERAIKAARGRVISSDGVVLADNKTVCTVSVVHSQITDAERVISVLTEELEMDEAKVRKYVEKVSSMEKVKTNVDKETGDRIRAYELDGVKVDEDSKRVYPYATLASKVLGFTGADNQGIVGLEVEYESILKGNDGMILTLTDAEGVELDEYEETRVEPEAGKDLYLSLDYTIQSYATQAAKKAYEANQAKSVSIIIMNPNNGEILAMVNYPEYDLNDPFVVEDMDELNAIWRNSITNDTYEPGSIFKTVTATAALETGAVTLENSYTCGGRIAVADRSIRCHKTTGHGTQTFRETLMNSCNPAFVTWGLRTGKDNFLSYMDKLGLMSKTGIDLPGEASTIMHDVEAIKELDLAVMSFGQSFQITPLQMMRAVSAIINGGTLVTPHFGVKTIDAEGNITELEYEETSGVIEKQTSETMKSLMLDVVAEGGGKRCYIEGYSIGGKTATSQKLPRGNGKYVASFIGFAPADNPEVIAMCLIDEPSGIYYGGTIATPVICEIFQNIFPYLGIEKGT